MSAIDNAIRRAELYAPYLAESSALYPDISASILVETPEHLFEKLCRKLPKDVGSLETEMVALRQFKRRAHLIIAIADLAGLWSWVEVTEHLTQLADLCMARLLRAAALEAGIEGSPENPVPGFFVLAVGKYGARELNYSSDIDFNVFYDPEKVVLPNPGRAERSLIKVVQSLIKGFERITGDGYIFRTDLRLRPDPRSNAVAVSTHTAERYYETLGQNWERAAMIKARVCGGDQATGQAFIDTVLSPFIWRRNLDYAAIDDILAIKRQIHAGKGGMHIHVPGHHLKLGKGGIREIEFYAQVQQLILGGRHENLRTMRTTNALKELAAGGFIEPEDAEHLTVHYGALRDFEHRAQMIDDAQTHHVPADDTERERYAKFCGFESREDLETGILEILKDVHRRYVNLFPDVETLSSREGNLVFTGVEPDPATLSTLTRLGYARVAEVWSEMSAALGGRIKATRSERAREYLTALAPLIIDFAADTGQPDRAFFAFSKFLGALNQGVSLLSMFSSEPERLAHLIELISRSEAIANRLAEKPAILDAMVDPDFLRIDGGSFAEEYDVALGTAGDFEDTLNAARRRVREDHFRISTGVLIGLNPVKTAASLFSAVADATVAGLLPAAIREVERVAGDCQGDVAVIGLGKMGGREMRLTSDLDIMLVYRPGPDEENPQRYYAKLTQRLINALSAVTEEGGLFEVDMALRPSGRSGPVAVSLDAFTTYYAEKAWTWEFMALTRGRVIAASSDEFFKTLNHRLIQAITTDRADLDFRSDIADMLRRTRTEKPARHDWDIKNIEGGLRDAEYIAQSLCLKRRHDFVKANVKDSQGMISAVERWGLIETAEARALISALAFYDSLSQLMSMMGLSTDVTDFDVETMAKLNNMSGSAPLKKMRQKHIQTVSGLTQKYVLNV